MAVLALEKNTRFERCFLAGICRSLAAADELIVHRQNHDRSRMADHVAPCPDAAGFFHFVGGDGEYRPSIGEARRKNAGF